VRAHTAGALVLGLSAAVVTRGASPPSVEDFASPPAVEDVSISPDGRHLALISTHDGRVQALVVDRQDGRLQNPHSVLAEPDHFRMMWCRWATNTRLLCGLLGIADNGFVHGVTRLVGVDADGKNLRVLVQGNEEAQGQFQDRVISWHPGPADTVLIEADEGRGMERLPSNAVVLGNVGTHALPAVFELNVVTGRLVIRQRARQPIRHWISDGRGQVRLGYGLSGTTISYYARLDGDSEWRRLTKFEIFSRENHFKPVAISDKDPNKAYALGPSDARTALWLIDLADKEDPKLVFAHPSVDVSNATLAQDGRLLAVRYENTNPMQYFEDDDVRILMGKVAKLEPGVFTTLVGSTLDEKIYILRSISDIDAASFQVLDTDPPQITTLEAPYPDRDKTMLAPMRPISYPARDGTQIPGYLSMPHGGPSAHLALIVMPHGGPISRDSWGYFFLRQFLVSRGYAVLQMNFRGSSGYGENWFFAAHQDWGGLTYDDVVDGARWAVREGIADPERVCLVGWSFGGYIALVGAQRNPEVFHCAVDIAGVSDLGLLEDERSELSVKRQIGTDPAKLKLNSPRLHAADFKVPLLMLHGKMDAQVPFAQSYDMDSALTRAGKPHRFVVFPEADHQFSGAEDRAKLLHEIENFLNEHLPASH
jgi:dipeptidyl aminopeptidase/acylaminoacyl peptidase